MVQIDDLLGIPFKVHGRDKKGFDCYGYLKFLEHRCGHEMPDLHKEYTENSMEAELDHNAREFIKQCGLKKTDKPRTEDIVLFFDDKGRAVHVGFYLKCDDFTHCDGYGVRVSNLKTYFRQNYEVYTWQ